MRENFLSQVNLLEPSDFWWLSDNEVQDQLLIGLGHHPPLGEDDTPMPLKEWFHSLGEGMQLSTDYELYPMDFLEKWRSLCNNTNVYRTLELFTSSTGQGEIFGPFLVDIDNSKQVDGYEENLDDALFVACRVADFLIKHWQLSERDLRVFFTGRKGFNIEVRPSALGIGGTLENQIKFSRKRLSDIISYFGAGSNTVTSRHTTIDLVYGGRFNNHELKYRYVRLHGSWNKWVGNDGIERARRKIELSLNKLFDSIAEEIYVKAEAPE